MNAGWTIVVRKSADEMGNPLPIRANLTGWTDNPPPALLSPIGPLTAVDSRGNLFRVAEAIVAGVRDHAFSPGGLRSVPARHELAAEVCGEFGPVDTEKPA